MGNSISTSSRKQELRAKKNSPAIFEQKKSQQEINHLLKAYTRTWEYFGPMTDFQHEHMLGMKFGDAAKQSEILKVSLFFKL